ncbi:hypothetical protein [Xenophilus azovorans]|uniref:hypothetical protein n=1 Tax=Xenophilus azovorans TaxID=151755 RepID=UPI0012ED10A4|nr:hypothetical protein [Xenophilus azovorans]
MIRRTRVIPFLVVETLLFIAASTVKCLAHVAGGTPASFFGISASGHPVPDHSRGETACRLYASNTSPFPSTASAPERA